MQRSWDDASGPVTWIREIKGFRLAIGRSLRWDDTILSTAVLLCGERFSALRGRTPRGIVLSESLSRSLAETDRSRSFRGFHCSICAAFVRSSPFSRRSHRDGKYSTAARGGQRHAIVVVGESSLNEVFR